MQQALTTFGELLGAFIVACGFWMIFAPLGVIIGGFLLAFFCYLAAR